ncbi:MAG: helix-turn-helix domain-containing protein [Anaerolineales bacterium]
MDRDFADWLIAQMNKRGWSQADLANAAGLNRQVISTYVNRQRRKPDSEVLVALARALRLPPEVIFRAAGLLPPVSADTEYREEFFHLLSQLSPQEQQEILELLRFKAERKSVIRPTSLAEKPARMVLKEK